MSLGERTARPAKTDRRLSTGARRTQEDRTRETRQQLLDAAIAILLERGYDGFVMMEVAVRAGVSNGARVHHFKTKADLVIAAAQRTYEHSSLMSRSCADRARQSGNPIMEFVDFCFAHYFGWPFTVSMELVNKARTDPEIKDRIVDILAEFHTRLEEDWREILLAAGYTHQVADRQFQITLTHVRGLALNGLWRASQPDERRRITSELLAYFETRDGQPRPGRIFPPD